MEIINLLGRGPLDYMDVDALQRFIHREVAALTRKDTLIVWESKETYTAGRRTQPEDIPHDDIPVIAMDRGGSVTYHGPGQLVVYPIVKVRPPKDVVAFVRRTEEATMAAAAELGVHTVQIEGRSGVWVVAEGTEDRKLCAIGIKFAEDATLHGLAFNVSTDVDRFMQVVPCGLADAGVATLEQMGKSYSLEQVADVLLPHLAKAYQPFRREGRNDVGLNTIDPAPILDSVRQQRDSLELPKNTGVAWSNPRKENA